MLKTVKLSVQPQCICDALLDATSAICNSAQLHIHSAELMM